MGGSGRVPPVYMTLQLKPDPDPVHDKCLILVRSEEQCVIIDYLLSIICILQNVLAPNCKHPNTSSSNSSNDNLADGDYGVDPWDYQEGWPPFSKCLFMILAYP